MARKLGQLPSDPTSKAKKPLFCRLVIFLLFYGTKSFSFTVKMTKSLNGDKFKLKA